MNEFEFWWHHIGSAIMPEENDDYEEHTEKVCQMFFKWLKEDSCYHCMAVSSENRRQTEYCEKSCYKFQNGFAKTDARWGKTF